MSECVGHNGGARNERAQTRQEWRREGTNKTGKKDEALWRLQLCRGGGDASVHAPAACLKTPGLFAFSSAELRHSRLAGGERARYPPSPVLFFTRSLFLNNLRVFRPPCNEETGRRRR